MASKGLSKFWSSQYRVGYQADGLYGDKIRLPSSALEQLLSAPWTPQDPEESDAEIPQDELPHPLMFRLTNTQNGNSISAGIIDFAAEEGTIDLSIFVSAALGLDPDQTVDGSRPSHNVDHFITVEAQPLPRGSYVRLRPLEAGYDPDDWKALLEQTLRANFTTLSKGGLLSVPGSRVRGRSEDFKFLIDKILPEGNAICIVDTDLEVDIEALDEEQARETLKRRLEKTNHAPSTAKDSSAGGRLEYNLPQEGQVCPGEYVDYQMSLPEVSYGIEIEVTSVPDGGDIEVFISSFSPRQRSKPREDEYMTGDFSSIQPKRIRLTSTNTLLDEAEQIWVAVYGYPDSAEDQSGKRATRYTITTKEVGQNPNHSQEAPTADNPDKARTGEERCKNCHQWVPSRTMVLHQNFCYRNNIACPKCENVFQKNSDEWKNHWHCQEDDEYGNSGSSQQKHNHYMHTAQTCPTCPFTASNIPELAQHRTSTCPGKIILCQFCHLEVPQEGDPFVPNAEALLSNLTPHELADGARTTECHLCSKIVRLRDMKTHLRYHDLERVRRVKPIVCRNSNCGRTLYGVSKNGAIGTAVKAIQSPGNDMGLCRICYGPLYVSTHDPDGKALYRRLERRYLSQLLTGCKQNWCQNGYCKQGRVHRGIVEQEEKLSVGDALPLIKPFIEQPKNVQMPLHFCVGDSNQRNRDLAEVLEAASSKSYELAWCIAAMEATGSFEEGHSWLKDWAPRNGEVL
ncbi:MAG: hypothetical protein M1814_000245 [Vezdaea aestivalis]|nr:MAG: hypothetical protein M1814_000245 [Vezdaea aestivalis]